MYSAQFVTRYRFFGNLWRRAALNLCGIQVSRSEVEHPITRTTCVRATTSFPSRFQRIDATLAAANLRNVWTIATGSFKDARFATFPTVLCAPCIRAGTSERGVCPECGAPWARHIDPAITTGKAWHDHQDDLATGRSHSVLPKQYVPAETLGWLQSCKCSTHSPVPATVLDPFGGAGTVGNVAVMGVNRIGKNEQPCENSHLATGFDYDWLRFKRYLGNVGSNVLLGFDK